MAGVGEALGPRCVGSFHFISLVSGSRLSNEGFEAMRTAVLIAERCFGYHPIPRSMVKKSLECRAEEVFISSRSLCFKSGVPK
jgi:hypothetical protein